MTLISSVQSLDELKIAVEQAVAQANFAEVTALLAPIAANSASRDLAEQLWIHRQYGVALFSSGQAPEGTQELERAYSLDPRDRDVALTYAEVLLELGQREPAISVFRSLLVHNKAELKADMLGRIYCTLGEHHLNHGEGPQAMAAYDQGLAVQPDAPRAAEGMLRAIATLDDPNEAVRAQRVMLRRLSDKEAKAAVLVHIADDLTNKLNDPEGALRALDEAVALAPQGAELAVRRSDLLLALDRPEEAAEALTTLLKSNVAIEGDARLELLEKIQQILGQSKGGHAKRIVILDQILDASPSRLDLFEELTVVCADAELWEQLASAYKRMIQRLESSGDSSASRAIPLLWRNLGEVLESHLGRPSEAYDALNTAAKLLPQDIGLRRRLLELVKEEDDKLLEALRLQQELIALDPEERGQLEDYARLLLRAGRYDEALCVLRVLRAEGRWSERWERHFVRLQRPNLKLPTRMVTEEMRRTNLRPASQSQILDAIMMVAEDAFGRLFANDMAAVGITEKDRLDLGQDLLFARLYDQIGRLLGRRELPRVYVKRAMTGMANAALDKPAFIIGPDMLSGQGERELAFIIAQQFTLLRPEYILTTTHQAVHLRSVLLVLVNHVDPSIPVPQSADTDQLKRVVEKYRKREARKHLEGAVKKLVKQQLDVNVDMWVDSVADEAINTGLLFCDDLSVADRAIVEHPGVAKLLDHDVRREALHKWAVSDDYFRMRFDLGLSVQES